MNLFIRSIWPTLLTAALALSSQAGQQIIETDNSLVSKTGSGFFNMYITYGRRLMGSGDYIVTTTGTNSSFDYTIPAGNRSVSAMFLFHNQGQIAEVYIDGSKRTTVDTFARSSVAQRQGGVVGQIREILVASDLDRTTNHTLRIVNTATTSSDSHYTPRELNQGPQLAVDALRLGDFEFGTISGVVKDDSGRPLGDLRMTINCSIGPINDDSGRSVIHTDGFGRYSFSGLTRGSTYTIAINEHIADYTFSFTVPAGGGSLVKDVTVPCLHISRPRLAVPSFALRGGSFEIEVDAKDGVSQWRARLRNAYKSVELPVKSAAYGLTNIQDHSKPGWTLKVAVPSDTPLELWDLELVCSQGVRREPRCVKVMDNFDRSFYVAQITDVHCYGAIDAKNDRRMAQMLSILDAIGARFIAITGDLCHFKGVRQAWSGFAKALTDSCNDTPTCVLPGNHDTLEKDSQRGVSSVDMEYNHNLYERIIGQPRYDFRMGNVYVLVDDIFSGDSGWAGRKLAATTANDQIRLVLSHYHTLNCDPRVNPTILLFGHNHINQHLTNGVPPHTYPAISVVTAKDENKKKQANEFRLVRFNRDNGARWSLGAYTYNGSDKNGVPAAEPGNEITSSNLKRNYANPNDGTQSSNSVSFFNNTVERFETASARFVMRKGAYTVVGGKVVDSYASDDQSKQIVLVEINAAPNATTSVSIRPTATN